MHEKEIRDRARKIWEEVLGTEVTDDTDFFDIGGHSFMAIRIIALMNESLPAPAPVTTLFDHPVFADFVAAVR